MSEPGHYMRIVGTCEVMAEDINDRFEDVGILTIVAQYDKEDDNLHFYYQSAGNINVLEAGIGASMEENPEMVLLLSNSVACSDSEAIMDNFRNFVLRQLDNLDNSDDDNPFGLE